MRRVKNFFVTEWDKLKEMTFTQKRQYIWEYYKIQIIAFAFIAVVFIVASRGSEQSYIYIAWMADNAPPTVLLQMEQGLGVIVADGYRERVHVSDYALSGNMQRDTMLQQRFTAMMHSRGVDMFVVTYQGVYEIAGSSLMYALDDVMASVLEISPLAYEQIFSRVLSVYIDEGLETGDVARLVAISLEGAPLFESLQLDMSGRYMAVSANTMHLPRVVDALVAIFDMEAF